MKLKDLTRTQLEALMIKDFVDLPEEEALPKVFEKYADTDFVEEDFFTDRNESLVVVFYCRITGQFLEFSRSYKDLSFFILETHPKTLDDISISGVYSESVYIDFNPNKTFIENVIDYLKEDNYEMNDLYDIDYNEWERLRSTKFAYEETVCNELERYIGQ